MKVHMRLLLETDIQLPDELHPGIGASGWVSRYGYIAATEGPRAQGNGADNNANAKEWVRAARAELAAMIAKHGVSCLPASLEIRPEEIPWQQ